MYTPRRGQALPVSPTDLQMPAALLLLPLKRLLRLIRSVLALLPVLLPPAADGRPPDVLQRCPNNGNLIRLVVD